MASGRLIVDTNAVIAYWGGNQSVIKIIENADALYLPVVVLGELLYGALNSSQPDRNRELVFQFLDHSTLLPLDEGIASSYAEIRTQLKREGKPIPENDIWIAATCQQLDAPLLTRDAHFKHVHQIRIASWGEGGTL